MSAIPGRHGLSRRVFLGSACVGAAVLCVGRAAVAQGRKLTKLEAGYRDDSKDGSPCGACALFQDPKYCVIVEGEVSPDGTCNYFANVE